VGYLDWFNFLVVDSAILTTSARGRKRTAAARGIFTSVSDFACKLRRYINAYSANARPMQWKYSDPTPPRPQ
jgi:hypothetical protein